MAEYRVIYALYKGEVNIMDGTLEEIAERNNYRLAWVRYMLSPKYKIRIKNGKDRLELCFVGIEKNGRML